MISFFLGVWTPVQGTESRAGRAAGRSISFRAAMLLVIRLVAGISTSRTHGTKLEKLHKIVLKSISRYLL